MRYSLMTAVSANGLTVTMLLNVLIDPGTMADCGTSHLFLTAPKRIEALSGSCLLIPCNYSVPEDRGFDPTNPIVGLWLNHTNFNVDKNVVFDSSREHNIYPINITGDLKKKNCTTLFFNVVTKYTHEYFFRIQNGKFKATAICDPLYIKVQDSAWSPTIEIPADLKEEESVTVTCSANTPCPQSPPELTWNLQTDSQRQTEKNSNLTFTSKIQKNITLSDAHDGFTINCSVSYPVDKGNSVKTAVKQHTLNVSYAPKDTSVSISPLGLVPVGSWVNLTCSSRANPPHISFSWFKISKEGDIKVADGDFHTFNATENAEYHCIAANRMGNQTSEIIALRIKEPLDESLTWKIILGGGVVLICLIVCSLALLCWRRKNSTARQKQASTRGNPSIETESTNEENIHYGEIKFARKNPTSSAQISREEVDTIYAQVKV
ncbi:B-cell receptor CD22-like [Oryzias melastigma]|uniref:B-cell receptor CD22-like n=1 Tax=Oryzias melastigma TaxID=30732 RepID=UPI00168CD383|nr:B-cell receptor CD22-like [Oryzias melastigma]